MSATGSGIEGLLSGCAFARFVSERLQSETFKLIDVGCSGGLPGGFREFGDRLEALAFDGLGEEIVRLAAAEDNPKVRYVQAMVGLPDEHPLQQRLKDRGHWHNWPSQRYAYERHQYLEEAKAAGVTPLDLEQFYHQVVLKQEWVTWPFPSWDTDYAATFEVYEPAPEDIARALNREDPDAQVDLAAYALGSGFEDVDFIKIDIDGPDYRVLRSINTLLARPSLLGVALEVNFIGSHDANDNSFHNMDRLMREKGFDLAGLSIRTYSSAAAPYRYLDFFPSMNEAGRPVQGDAIYIRDLGSRVRAKEAAELSDEKLAKAAALLAMFSVPDWAAEMLIVHRARLSRLMDVDEGLDLLAAQVQVNHDVVRPHREFIAEFEARNPLFFDLYGLRNRWMDEILDTARKAPHVAEELREAQATVNALRETAEAQSAAAAQEIAVLRRELEALRASTSWKLTAPLRKLLGRGR